MGRPKNPLPQTSAASPHTIKKFELIEAYVKEWAQKLLNFQNCDGIVFIDCMSNSGVYYDECGNEIYGTPIRVAKYISDIMKNYPHKKAQLFFNDLSAEKIALLKTHLPDNTNNFKITTHTEDGNELLKRIKITPALKLNYLLIYDPYEASVDWTALMPFLINWGEVIINHMVSDSIRGVTQAKREVTKAKYSQTYLADFDELLSIGCDRDTYEQRFKEIILAINAGTNSNHYVSSFPFFNKRNALVYNLIHCTGNIEGFKLYKKIAWQTFGGKSSGKNTHGMQNQLMLDFSGSGEVKTQIDENCYYIQDIAEYLQNKFDGQADVPLSALWEELDQHPVFPSEGYKPQIKEHLKDSYSAKTSKSTITFIRRKV